MAEFVSWKNVYSIGIRLVDDQHKYLLDLTNDLYASCIEGGGAAKERFRQTVKATVEYVGVHFATEELLMHRINYPDITAHKHEHKMFVQQVLANVKDFESGQVYTPNAFVRFLRDWILEHVAQSDKKFGDYLIQIKKDGNLRI